MIKLSLVNGFDATACVQKKDMTHVQLKKGGGAEGAGVVLIFEGSATLLIARERDSLFLGFPVLQDNPQASTRPREVFSRLHLRRRPL